MATAEPTKKDRLVVKVHFDEKEMPYCTLPTGKVRFGVITHYVEKPSQTPSGGKFTSRRFTLRAPGGRRWYGQMKKGSDLVTLRPAPEK